MTTRTPRLSTRLLLTCAAVGAASALVFIPTVYFGAAILAAVPWAYGLIAGSYLLPGVVVQSLFRRGGLAILTSTIGGLVTAPFVAGGVSYILIFALVGAVQEIPFLVSGYRYWKGWVFFVGAVVIGLIIGGATLVGLAAETATGLAEIVHSASFLVGFLAFTALGRVVARQLGQTGVARGLQRPVDRRRSVVSA